MSVEFSGIARNAVKRMKLWCERARERRVLSEMDDTLLRDIGLTRGDARDEAQQPFWRGDDRRTPPRREAEGRASRLPRIKSGVAPQHEEGGETSAIALGRKRAQPRFVAFSEKESASRGWLSGRRNSAGSSAGSIIGKRR
jgi:uncharacterized protein YjiS (DUF1127 family)